jgi:hypothetical protein
MPPELEGRMTFSASTGRRVCTSPRIREPALWYRESGTSRACSRCSLNGRGPGQPASACMRRSTSAAPSAWVMACMSGPAGGAGERDANELGGFADRAGVGVGVFLCSLALAAKPCFAASSRIWLNHSWGRPGAGSRRRSRGRNSRRRRTPRPEERDARRLDRTASLQTRFVTLWRCSASGARIATRNAPPSRRWL